MTVKKPATPAPKITDPQERFLIECVESNGEVLRDLIQAKEFIDNEDLRASMDCAIEHYRDAYCEAMEAYNEAIAGAQQ